MVSYILFTIPSGNGFYLFSAKQISEPILTYIGLLETQFGKIWNILVIQQNTLKNVVRKMVSLFSCPNVLLPYYMVFNAFSIQPACNVNSALYHFMHSGRFIAHDWFM